jgi:ribosomal protein L16 Arg81 hydroxylase
MTSSSFLITLNCEENDSGLKLNPKEFRDIFSYLTNNSAKFFEEYWEQCPVHFKRGQKETSKIVNQNAFSRRKLLEIVNSNSLPIDTNLSAVKYVKKARESRHFNSDVASGDEIEKAFKEKYTVQFFQPQRFSDELHYINAGFEHIFGSLAGASAYLTPANTQGLAPHHDDVDVFVLQVYFSVTLIRSKKTNGNITSNGKALLKIEYVHNMSRMIMSY